MSSRDSSKDKRPDRALIRQLRSEHYTLAREHGEAKRRVQEYTSRRHLSPGEEMECSLLQRVKLQRKDALQNLEDRLRTLEEQDSRADGGTA